MLTSIPPSIDQETDPDLLCLIGMAEDDPAAAKAAFSEFHKRHALYVQERLLKWIFDLGDVRRRAIDGEALAADTLIRAFANAGKYKDRSCGDKIRATRQVRAWLMIIAQNLVRDALKNSSVRILLKQQDEFPEADLVEDISPPKVTNGLVAAVRPAMAQLKEVDREILETCLVYDAFGDDAARLPSNVRKDLIARHGLTEVTFRQRKCRALNQVRDLLSPKTRSPKSPCN